MTNLEALTAAANYPIEENKIKKILIDRGIDEAGTYAGQNQAFELATADLYTLLVSSANVAEGGYNVSMTDKGNMMKMASAIYTKHGVDNPLKPNIRNRSNYW